MDKNNLVWAATRKEKTGGGTVGYFKTREEIPPEFTYPGQEDIAGVMESMQLTDVDRCLEIMNQHWQEPVIGPRCPETYVRDSADEEERRAYWLDQYAQMDSGDDAGGI